MTSHSFSPSTPAVGARTGRDIARVVTVAVSAVIAVAGSYLGTSAGTQDFKSVAKADVIMVIGANPTDGHPVFGRLVGGPAAGSRGSDGGPELPERMKTARPLTRMWEQLTHRVRCVSLDPCR